VLFTCCLAALIKDGERARGGATGDLIGVSSYRFFSRTRLAGESGDEGKLVEDGPDFAGSNAKEFWLLVLGTFSAVFRCCIACITEAGVPARPDDEDDVPLILDDARRLEDGAGRFRALALKKCEIPGLDCPGDDEGGTRILCDSGDGDEICEEAEATDEDATGLLRRILSCSNASYRNQLDGPR
jgi:hypothetical protein